MTAERDERDGWLASGVASRDPAAITAVYEALADPLFRYLRSRCHDDELAADMVEATFVELIEAAPRLAGDFVGVRRWLFTAARHNLLDEHRKLRRRGDVALNEEPGADGTGAAADHAAAASDPTAGGAPARGQPGHADPAATPEDQIIDAERDEQVRRAIATLPDPLREVLELRFAGELSAIEAGEVMGRSPGAVRVLQHRALKALAAALEEPPLVAPGDRTEPAVADRLVRTPPRGPPASAS